MNAKKLRDELNENTNNMITQRKLHVKESYDALQTRVVNKLKKYSNNYYNHECEITIGDLYIKNYYDQPTNIEYTKLGYVFANRLKSELSYPSLNELEYLSYKLEKYLKSQGLNVEYTSHCCIKISWL